jgi:hypothetical protein
MVLEYLCVSSNHKMSQTTVFHDRNGDVEQKLQHPIGLELGQF